MSSGARAWIKLQRTPLMANQKPGNTPRSSRCRYSTGFTGEIPRPCTAAGIELGSPAFLRSQESPSRVGREATKVCQATTARMASGRE